MPVYPSNTNIAAAAAAGQSAPRQGEIASLDAELASDVQENASLITRLYDLADRLGVSPPPSDSAPSPYPPRPGQIGELRDTADRLRRENSSFIRVLEALETL